MGVSTSSRTAPATAVETGERSPRAEQLLEALEEIFLREGFRRVTVGALAQRLHCSRQTLYQLAPSKGELCLLVLRRFLARIREMGTRAADTRSDIRDQLLALVEPGVSELRRASSLFFADVADFPPARRLLEQHQTARREAAQTLIAAGIRQGAFRGLNSQLAAEVVFTALQRVMDPPFLLEVGLPPGEALRQAQSLLLHGLLLEEVPPGAARRATDRKVATRRSRRWVRA